MAFLNIVGDFVVFAEKVYKVFIVVFVQVLYFEIVHHKEEHYRPRHVLKTPRVWAAGSYPLPTSVSLIAQGSPYIQLLISTSM